MKVHVSGKYGQKLHHHTKKSATHAIKTASRKAAQKTVEATDKLTGNKIANKIQKTWKVHHNKSSILQRQLKVK